MTFQFMNFEHIYREIFTSDTYIRSIMNYIVHIHFFGIIDLIFSYKLS